MIRTTLFGFNWKMTPSMSFYTEYVILSPSRRALRANSAKDLPRLSDRQLFHLKSIAAGRGPPAFLVRNE
jgi:hypothetical protein